MQATLDETNYRREKQMKYNEEHGKIPQALNKKISENLVGRSKDFPDEKYTHKRFCKKLPKPKQATEVMILKKLLLKNRKKWKLPRKILTL